jgi:hypothetical protein
MLCAECKREIAETSQSCPVCGAPVSSRARAQARARAMTDLMRPGAQSPEPSVIAEPSPGLPADAIEWFPSSPVAGQEVPWDTARPTAAAGKSLRFTLAIYGVAITVLVAVIVVVALAQSSPTRRPTAWTRHLTEDQLRPGDCLIGSDLRLGSGSAWPYTVTAVPCTQRHLAEIIFAGNLWPASLATYPGDNAVTNTVDSRCQSKLTAYAGESKWWLTYDSVAPSGGSDWDSGDRLVVCMAYEAGYSLFHSVKSTHR